MAVKKKGRFAFHRSTRDEALYAHFKSGASAKMKLVGDGPRNFVIVDERGEPLSTAKVDGTISRAYRSVTKAQSPTGQFVVKGKIIHASRSETSPSSKVEEPFVVRVSPGTKVNPIAIRRGLYDKLQHSSKRVLKGGKAARYSLQTKNGAIIVREQPETDTLNSAPSDSIDALQKLAKFYLP